MSKPSIEQTRMGGEAVCLLHRAHSDRARPLAQSADARNLRKMWELLEAREDHGAADMVDTMIKALNDPAFFKP